VLSAAIVCGLLVGAVIAVHPAAGDDFDASRQRMLAEIRGNAAAVGTIAGKSGIDDAVLAAMARVPRHRFVPLPLQASAYDDRPLPIGFGQTISQPFIVALMTALLQIDADDSVLEVGTGSGYQAAVLGELARAVFSIEIIPELAESARRLLDALHYRNVQVQAGDGYFGWPEHGPFDAIIVTAASGHIPPPLIDQLRPGGRMVIPVGGAFAVQQLVMVEKRPDGSVITRHLLPVRFVPLTGGH
jgi:protein-L-isoaspartate(D-aspartate) O-methyltransferase